MSSRDHAPIDRRAFLGGLLLSGLGTPIAVEGQTEKKARIGVLMLPPRRGAGGTDIQALQEGLRDLGYVEGKNMLLEIRWAEGRHDLDPHRRSLRREWRERLSRDGFPCHSQVGTPSVHGAEEGTDIAAPLGKIDPEPSVALGFPRGGHDDSRGALREIRGAERGHEHVQLSVPLDAPEALRARTAREFFRS